MDSSADQATTTPRTPLAASTPTASGKAADHLRQQPAQVSTVFGAVQYALAKHSI